MLVFAALSAVPLIGMVALAVDFARTSVVKSSLDQAADSSALLATTFAANAYKANDANAVAEAVAAAQSRFKAQSGTQYDYVGAAPTVVLTRNGGLFNATVNYNALTPTTFGRVLGVAGLPISGQSSASLSLNPYVDVQILMDVSSSMTVAATTADIAKMQTLTTSFHPTGKAPDNAGQNCAFACHWSATDPDYYQLAVKNKIQLRITVLQSAVTNLINTINGLDTGNIYRLGLYTFGQKFKEIYPLTSDIADGLPAVSQIVPDINFCTNTTCPDTYYGDAMSRLATIDQAAAQQGTQTPQKFLFLVTDGVYDQFSPTGSTSNRQIGAFKPSDCDAVKAAGVSILVLYTPYLPLPTNSFYNQYVAPISSQIEPNLRACASSSSYFFPASDAIDIQTQLQNMLNLVVQSTSHLTH